MESRILYDPNGKYTKESEIINKFGEEELKNKLKETIGYIKYIVGKESRWEIREAYPHMHNKANMPPQMIEDCIIHTN
jgi:hypothetical protein